MDIKQQTQNVAAQGRYGDSMLMHVNPAEVKGLASAMPLTVNPQTGQPEAFLPFLAPLLGSTLFSSLAGAGMLGTTLAANSALAAGIGAGLATYAESGGSGSKALLSGLTAGFGTNAANTAAQSAVTDAATQANIAGTSTLAAGIPMAPEAAATAAQQAALATPRAATGSFNALTDTFSGSFDQGAKALASGAMSPSGMVAGAAAGSRGIIESQEAFARQMGESEEAYRRRKEQNELMNPEPVLYAAGGGRTGFLEGGYSGGYGFEPGNFTGNLPQIFAPARTQYQVNPDFKAGFSPETMYFDPRTISAPASQLVPVAPELGLDTYQGSKGGYGGRQASIADQVSIDPFAAYTGSPPKGLEFSERPIPPPVFEKPQLPDIGIPDTGLPDFGNLPDFGSPDVRIPENFDLQSILDGINNYNSPEREIDTGTGFAPQLPIIETSVSDVEPDFIMPPYVMPEIDLPAPATLAPELIMPAPIPQTLGEQLPPGTDNGLDISNFLGSKEDNLAGAQAMFGPQVQYATPTTGTGSGGLLGRTLTNTQREELGIPSNSGGFLGKGYGVDPIPEPIAATQFSPEIDFSNFNLTPEMLAAQESVSQVMPEMLAPQLPQEVMPRNSILRTMDFRGQMAEGGKLPNAGLKALNKVAPEVVDNMGFAEGGMADINNDPLTQEVTMFILGQSENEEALSMFIEKYGNESFMQLREMVLQSVVPNAQTEGQIAGVGNGGMDDDINGTIGNQEKIAVSQDEFIVPADVVSMLGDGSSNAGSKELYDMMDRVRQEKTGTTTQASKLANAGGMLPA